MSQKAEPENKIKPDYRAPIIIVGGGLAGLYAALQLAPVPVLLVTSSKLGEGVTSMWAQGGISASCSSQDSVENHMADTIRVGAGLVEKNMAGILAKEACENVDRLIELGVPFDRNEDGTLAQSKEAGHSFNRVVRITGDSAGKGIMEALIKKVRATKSIKVLDRAIVKKIAVYRGRVKSVHIWPASSNSAKNEVRIKSRFVLLASGGVGGLFARTTGPKEANGETLAIAAKAGAVIADPEFIQFHPTAIDADTDPVPLATESLRGEGAFLIDEKGCRLMNGIHKDADLAPRDIVARAVWSQLKKGNKVFLDCREAIGEDFPQAFPTVYKYCQNIGIDPVKEPIPVAPAAHYHMGGVFTDSLGRTTVDGLWACGEVASTGAHGANRLASNSLTEALVFSRRAATDMQERLMARPGKIKMKLPFEYGSRLDEEKQVPTEGAAISKLRSVMASGMGILRSETHMRQALVQVKELARKSPENVTLQNMVTACEIILVAALERKESRGAHAREDYTKTEAKYARRTMTTLEQTRINMRNYLDPNQDNEPHLKLVVGN